MDIAVLVLWMFTAGVGLYLLMTAIAVRRVHTANPPPAGEPHAGDPPASAAATAGVPTPGVCLAAGAPTPGAGPPPGDPPPIPRVRVVAGPDDHPLREFMHPAFAIAGLGCWLAYVATRYPAFAWFSLGALIVTVGAGLGWLTTSARSAKRRRGGDRVPAYLITLHGLAAGATFALAVLTILTASGV